MYSGDRCSCDIKENVTILALTSSNLLSNKNSMNYFLPTELETNSKEENILCFVSMKKQIFLLQASLMCEKKTTSYVATKYRKQSIMHKYHDVFLSKTEERDKLDFSDSTEDLDYTRILSVFV